MTEFLIDGAAGAQAIVGLLIVLMAEIVRRAVKDNTAEQRNTATKLSELASAMSALKAATEAETRAIRADLVIHERRLDGHDEAFRRMGRHPGGSGSAGSAKGGE